MTSTVVRPADSARMPWLVLAYLVLCFHYFGMVVMTRFFNYQAFRLLREDVRPVFGIFQSVSTMIGLCAHRATTGGCAGLVAASPRGLIAAPAGLSLVGGYYWWPRP